MTDEQQLVDSQTTDANASTEPLVVPLAEATAQAEPRRPVPLEDLPADVQAAIRAKLAEPTTKRGPPAIAGNRRELAAARGRFSLPRMDDEGRIVSGIHRRDERGQYVAEGVGRNDACPCGSTEVPLHKHKRHAQVMEPVIRARLAKAIEQARAEKAAENAEAERLAGLNTGASEPVAEGAPA